jgi:hypothetical protein
MPWRDVVEPHQDVATGEFQQAEFAADLAKVHNGSAPYEYSDPREFFSRTYLTDGSEPAAGSGAAKRLSGQWRRSSRRAADQLRRRQDALDAGALPHGERTPVHDLPGLDQLLSEKG